MRVEIGVAVAISRQSHGKTHDGVPIKRTEDLTADTLSYQKNSAGNQIAIAVSPDLELQNNAAFKLLERRQWSNLNSRFVVCVHAYQSFALQKLYKALLCSSLCFTPKGVQILRAEMLEGLCSTCRMFHRGKA